MLNISINHPELKFKLDHNSSVFFIGSCFSENISKKLSQRKVKTLSNPYGILFDSLAIEKSISDIVSLKNYSFDELCCHQQLLHSWHHHSDYSDTNAQKSIEKINQSIQSSYQFLKSCSHVVITLGSAFSYYLLDENKYVANCHKVPQTQFRKDLISIDNISSSLDSIYTQVRSLNPQCQFILTISPVRHLRDGVVENNRSKSRLIEAVHQFISSRTHTYYFPSYELVIDVLRDYRYYDIDMAHPNYQATEIVFDYFKKYCIDKSSHDIMDEFYKLHLGMNHRTRFPETDIHKKFLESNLQKTNDYSNNYPQLNFDQELNYFKNELEKTIN